jgi:restriction system protein
MIVKKSRLAKECFDGNFIETDFLVTADLTNKLPENWRDFNREFIPVFMASHPDKSKIATNLNPSNSKGLYQR